MSTVWEEAHLAAARARRRERVHERWVIAGLVMASCAVSVLASVGGGCLMGWW